MTLLEIITVLIILGITTQIFLNFRKKNSEKDISLSQAKVQKPESKPTTDHESTAKPQSLEPAISVAKPEPVVTIKPSEKPPVDALEVSITEYNSLIPEDSILKRHYLSHLSSLIEALSPPRPTDSVLSRHHDAIQATRLVQCTIDQKAYDQLLNEYEYSKSFTFSEVSAQPKEFLVEVPCSNIIPEDSILKRHYLTHISSMIEELGTIRPTDSVLCRHHDAILAAKLLQCLNNKEVMQQLFEDYENRK